jgi:hypothetical protein
MPRTLSFDMTAACNAQNCALVFCWVCVIQYVDSATGADLGLMVPIYLADHKIDISVNGQTYTGVGFQFIPPEESDDGFKTGKITLNNVTRWLTTYIRGLSGGEFIATLSLVSITDASATPPEFDTTEIVLMPMQLRMAEINATVFSATLTDKIMLENAFPPRDFNPIDNPGCWGA